MKSILHKLSTFIFLLLLSLPTYALSIETGTYERDDEQRPGIRVYLDVNADEVRDAFIDYLKDKYDFKLKGDGLFANKDELYAEEILIQEIIDKRINWYTEIIESDRSSSKTRMTIFVNLGYDIYLSEGKYEASFDKVYDMVAAFVASYVPSYYNELISDTKEAITDLEEATNDLKKDIEKNQKDIEDLKSEIEEMETNISENEDQLKQKKKDLMRNQKSLQKAKKEISEIK
ncbi:MAG: hypothetical protein Sapg2KO_31450 [Saprospiraceae bacterium]